MKRFMLIGLFIFSGMQIVASGNQDETKLQESFSSSCISPRFVDQLKKSECSQNVVRICEKTATPVNLFATSALCCFFGGYAFGVACCFSGCYQDFKEFNEENEKKLDQRKYYNAGNNICRKQSIDENQS